MYTCCMCTPIRTPLSICASTTNPPTYAHLVGGNKAFLHVHDIGVVHLHEDLNLFENILPVFVERACAECYNSHSGNNYLAALTPTYRVNSSGDSCAPSLGRVITLHANCSPVVRCVTSRTVANPVCGWDCMWHTVCGCTTHTRCSSPYLLDPGSAQTCIHHARCRSGSWAC